MPQTSRGDLQREVSIPAGGVSLAGTLSLPKEAEAIVLFAHGSGSSRHSVRNVFVARALERAKLGTLLFDLLTEDEEAVDSVTREFRFDIGLLTARLTYATRWIDAQSDLKGWPLGYFGASTGSAAALRAAAALGNRIHAVVSRGGRPDLAIPELERVAAATLLIVGGRDEGVIELNERAFERLQGQKRFAIVSGATHLFEEPGALEEVARLACDWFEHHLLAAVHS